VHLEWGPSLQQRVRLFEVRLTQAREIPECFLFEVESMIESQSSSDQRRGFQQQLCLNQALLISLPFPHGVQGLVEFLPFKIFHRSQLLDNFLSVDYSLAVKLDVLVKVK
jgi:hypothetical protein